MSVPCYGAAVRYSHLVHCKLHGTTQILCLLCHQRCAIAIICCDAVIAGQ